MTLSGQTYRCSTGETWDSVAMEVYGDEMHACDLLGANPSLCRKPIFTGGEVLQLPIVEEREEAEEYMPASAPWKE